MMLWSLELEVLAWLCSNILEILHNPLNGRHVETPNSGSFDDYIPMELPHPLYDWLKCTPNTEKSNTISSVSQSTRVVTCSAIFSLKTLSVGVHHAWVAHHHCLWEGHCHLWWILVFYGCVRVVIHGWGLLLSLGIVGCGCWVVILFVGGSPHWWVLSIVHGHWVIVCGC